MIVDGVSIALTQSMFGTEFQSIELLGLRCGQMRGPQQVGHNAGWYNAIGEKLGWGDLDVSDIHRLMDALEENELFLILGEYDSHWNLLRSAQATGANHLVEVPGTVYVAKKAMYIVQKGKVLMHNTWSNDKECDIAPGFSATCYNIRRQETEIVRMVYRAASIAEKKAKSLSV